MIKVETFEKCKSNIYSNRKFHENQETFFNYALEQINNNTESERITVFPARCGLGKTTFLRILIKSWLADNRDKGLIIVTDNLQRLSELNDENEYKIAYLTAQNKATEIIRQIYCPILLISTQRFFQMDSIEPFLKYKCGDLEFCRDTVIFDETPYFFDDGEIGIEELNTLHSALNGGLSDLVDSNDKKWVLEQYDDFRNRMIETIKSLEQERNKTTYLFYQPIKDSITDNDLRLYSLLNDNSEVFQKYPAAKKIFQDIDYFIKNGGFFSSFKLKDNNTYHKSFIIRKSYLDKFLLGKVKTFIFDATADISELYPYEAEWLELLNCEQFDVSLDFLHIHIVDVNTSRNALLIKNDKNTKTDAIKNYIAKVVPNVDDTLFITYKALMDDGRFDNIGFTKSNALYFGNTKGLNNKRGCHTLVQVGLNRQSDIKYLLNFLSNNNDFELRVKNDIQDVQHNIKEIDSLLKSDLVNSYMSAEVVADFIQNLFRTKARDIFNEDRIDIYLFCKKTDNLMIELNYALGRKGTHIDVRELDELKIAKIENRKGNTKAKQVLGWLKKQPKGKMFNITQMFEELEINNEDFKAVKRANKVIKDKFKEMKIPSTRGKYFVA